MLFIAGLFIAGLFIGALVGYVTACLMFAAGKADREIHKKSIEGMEDWD